MFPRRLLLLMSPPKGQLLFSMFLNVELHQRLASQASPVPKIDMPSYLLSIPSLLLTTLDPWLVDLGGRFERR
jgi:hypothetical protein